MKKYLSPAKRKKLAFKKVFPEIPKKEIAESLRRVSGATKNKICGTLEELISFYQKMREECEKVSKITGLSISKVLFLDDFIFFDLLDYANNKAEIKNLELQVKCLGEVDFQEKDDLKQRISILKHASREIYHRLKDWHDDLGKMERMRGAENA